MATSDLVPGTPPKPRRRWQFSLRTAIVVMTLVPAIFAIEYHLYQADQAKRRQLDQAHQAKKRLLEANLEFMVIVCALRNFDKAFLRLPNPVRHAGPSYTADDDPNGKPLYSWRFPIMPNMMPSRKVDWDQAWDSPANAQWLTVGQPSNGLRSKDTTTRVFAIIGPDTPFGDGASEMPHALKELAYDTILFVEVRSSGVHWMEPGDFDIRTMPRTINAPDGRGISGEHAGGFFVGFADGEVWFLSNDVPFDELAKFFTIAGAKANSRERVLMPYKLN